MCTLFVFFSIFYPWKSHIEGIFSAHFSSSCGKSERNHCTPAHSDLPNILSFLQAEFSIFLSKGVQNSLVMHHPLLMWWVFAQLGPIWETVAPFLLSIQRREEEGCIWIVFHSEKIHSLLPLFMRAWLKWSIDVMCSVRCRTMQDENTEKQQFSRCPFCTRLLRQVELGAHSKNTPN